ncbi:serine/arginine repetitive matrix protein 2 [Streptomyces sp. ISL-100]|uniref:serine/arginine repetitive matrix protein 2 n=1 Tax=Streptomyces sp. ISL-100 TaxID=2819173 RepID=UPI001BEBD6E5|nr:serine/arginine repetitive matrix protein 2 [Streptomyces sp. ISL-100]MBT2396614.1 serine/arginine repetitive matrix protein 2 [Streptomyces sp. ISL-100]
MAGPYWNDEAQRWESGEEGRPLPHIPQPPPLPPLPSTPPPPPDSLTPAYVPPTHVPPTHVPPAYDPGAGPRSLRGRISPLAAGAAVVVLALGAATVWFTVGNGGGDQERTGAEGPQAVQSAEGTADSAAESTGDSTADSTASGETTAEESVTPDVTDVTGAPDATDAAQVPAGYRLVEDPEGFSVAVPDDWERSLEKERVFYRTADRASLIQIFRVTEAGMTPGEAVRLASGGLRDGTEGYEEISVGPVDGAVNESMSAQLVYEYDSEESGGRRRGVERVFRVSSGDLWAVLVAAPADEWPLQEKIIGTAIEHFKPNNTF